MIDERTPTHDDAPDAPPTADEIAASERLREALEGRATDNADAELVRALRLANSPRSIEPSTHAKILDRALPRLTKTSNVVRLLLGSSFAAAAAAAAALAVLHGTPPQLARSRSTSPLFDAPFPREGSTTARLDRIGVARGRDLRDNELARWGVK